MDLNRTAWVVLAVLLMAAGMFAARMTWEFMPRASAQDDLNCEEDFTYQEDAQSVLDRDPSDPNGRDHNQHPEQGLAADRGAVAKRDGAGYMGAVVAIVVVVLVMLLLGLTTVLVTGGWRRLLGDR